MKTTVKCETLIGAVVIVLAIAVQAPAFTALVDDFESYNLGDLVGQTAPNGEVWAVSGKSHDVVSAGLTGQGLQAVSGDSAGFISLGETLTNGIVTVAADVYNPDADNVVKAETYLRSDNGPYMNMRWLDTGLNLRYRVGPDWIINDVIGVPTTDWAHFEYTVNLDTGDVGINWNEIGGTGSGSMSKSYDPATHAFNPSNMNVYFRWQKDTAPMIDNLSIVDDGGGAEPPRVPTDFTWTAASGDWNESANWTPSFPSPSAPPGNPNAVQSSSHTATFADSIGSDARTVFTDEAVTVNRISFANTMGGSYHIAGHPSMNLTASTATPSVPAAIAAGQGSHVFQVPVNLLSDTTVDVGSSATLTFDGALSLGGKTLTMTGTGEMAINNFITTDGGTLLGLDGTISGGGTIGGDLNNIGGTISPGNSSSASAGSLVPEPATLAYAALGLLLLVGAWRKSR